MCERKDEPKKMIDLMIDLMKEWREEQSKDDSKGCNFFSAPMTEQERSKYPKYKECTTKAIGKDNFTYDGALIPSLFFTEPERIIFLLPEGNQMAHFHKFASEGALRKENTTCYLSTSTSDKDVFYFRDEVVCLSHKEENKREFIDGRKNYGLRLMHAVCHNKSTDHSCEEFYQDYKSIFENNKEVLCNLWKNVAYVNLNKAGGNGASGKHVKKYIEKYWCCIKKQLEILTTGTQKESVSIVLCGAYLRNNISNGKKEELCELGNLYTMLHPSARRSIEKFVFK